MDIFENLENLNVSEECFDEIMGIVEELLGEGENLKNMIHRAEGNIATEIIKNHGRLSKNNQRRFEIFKNRNNDGVNNSVKAIQGGQNLKNQVSSIKDSVAHTRNHVGGNDHRDEFKATTNSNLGSKDAIALRDYIGAKTQIGKAIGRAKRAGRLSK